MTRLYCVLSLLGVISCSYGQYSRSEAVGNISYGSINSGSGDLATTTGALGYNQFFTSHFAWVAEYRFASGVDEPKTLGEVYTQKSLNYVSAQVSYYPFAIKNESHLPALRGFHVSVGPSFVFGKSAFEDASYVTTVDNVVTYRWSHISIEHLSGIGFLITAGYKYHFERFSLGARIDLSSYTNTDGYSIIGIEGSVDLGKRKN